MKILLIGAGGFLGTKLYSLLTDKYEIIPYYFEKEPKLDITDKKALLKEFQKVMPSVVVHAAGITNVDLCETDKLLAEKVNVESTAYIVECCNAINAKLVYFSTDFVFDGLKGDYTEEDIPNPISNYGMTKLKSELIIREKSKNYLILRVAILYGHNGNGTERSFVNWLYESLKENTQINVVNDQFGTPTLIDDIANALHLLINKTGIYHLAGSQKLSRYDMAIGLAKEFGFDEKLVKPIRLSEFKQAAKRPIDSSLITEKIKNYGVIMNSFFNGLKIIKSQMNAK